LLVLWLAGCGDTGDGSGDGSSGAAGDETSTSSGSGETPTTGGEPASLEERACPEDSALSSENFGAPFMLTHCTGCHHSSLPASERAGAPLAIDFETIDLVRTHAPRIWARAADHNATMPPLGGPPLEERTRLGEWLACGAPTASEL
jgi:uncharacterized membrane protein